MNKNSILIASPINKDVRILKEFLNSLENLEIDQCKISYCFVDDNDNEDSSKFLKQFIKNHSNATILEIQNVYKNSDYEKRDHMWSAKKLEKLASIKNSMIQYFMDGDYTHLFFIDADLVIHPQTLQVLLESDKDIIANIFWTKWTKESSPLPQVWLKDFYTLYDDDMTIPRTQEQIANETQKFLNQLRVAGVYKVGGLGACTLIRREVTKKGVNFDSIYNVSFWGEDRSFCIRAAVAGFELYVNTIYPAFHIYRIEDLERLPEWHKRD